MDPPRGRENVVRCSSAISSIKCYTPGVERRKGDAIKKKNERKEKKKRENEEERDRFLFFFFTSLFHRVREAIGGSWRAGGDGTEGGGNVGG